MRRRQVAQRKDAGAHNVTAAPDPCVDDRVDACLLRGTLDSQDMTCRRASGFEEER
ncbi:alpha/beta hydrolase [Streptomyces sp. NPDC006627]|uniref:alpha/beta hydrolase n=1 Tax=Streptomyces sp. NPDC006627 TaxID=3154679 RepID=UPI0033AE55A8